MCICWQGQYLTRGSRLVDFVIKIGDGKCAGVSLADNEVVCRPPASRPNRRNSTRCDPDERELKVSLSPRSSYYSNPSPAVGYVIMR